MAKLADKFPVAYVHGKPSGNALLALQNASLGSIRGSLEIPADRHLARRSGAGSAPGIFRSYFALAESLNVSFERYLLFEQLRGAARETSQPEIVGGKLAEIMALAGAEAALAVCGALSHYKKHPDIAVALAREMAYSADQSMRGKMEILLQAGVFMEKSVIDALSACVYKELDVDEQPANGIHNGRYREKPALAIEAVSFVSTVAVRRGHASALDYADDLKKLAAEGEFAEIGAREDREKAFLEAKRSMSARAASFLMDPD